MFGNTWELCVEVTCVDAAYEEWSKSNPNNLIGKVKNVVVRGNSTMIWTDYEGDMNHLLDAVARSTNAQIRIDLWYVGIDGPYAGYQSATGGQYTIRETVVQGPITSPFYTECHAHVCEDCAIETGYITKEEWDKGLAAYAQAKVNMVKAIQPEIKSPIDAGFTPGFPL